MKKKLICLILCLAMLAISCDDSPTGPGEYDTEFLNYVAGASGGSYNTTIGSFNSTGRIYTSVSGVSYSFVVSKTPTSAIYTKGGFYYVITVGVSNGSITSFGFSEYDG